MLTESDIPEIKKLLALCLTDRQIGEAYGTSKQTIYSFRTRHKLRSHVLPGRPKDFRMAQEPHQEQLPKTMKDGLMITLCPARWALGIWPQGNVRCYE